ncbi:hypothetical protein Hanom_Chr05g00450611 [Helianthus anomalus]
MIKTLISRSCKIWLCIVQRKLKRGVIQVLLSFQKLLKEILQTIAPLSLVAIVEVPLVEYPISHGTSSSSARPREPSLNVPKIESHCLKLIEENLALLVSFMTAFENFAR